jgi:hypothetical protein
MFFIGFVLTIIGITILPPTPAFIAAFIEMPNRLGLGCLIFGLFFMSIGYTDHVKKQVLKKIKEKLTPKNGTKVS